MFRTDDGDIGTPPSQVPDGDSQVIQWKDPKEEVERKILQEKLALETQVLTEAARKSESECQVSSYYLLHRSTCSPNIRSNGSLSPWRFPII